MALVYIPPEITFQATLEIPSICIWHLLGKRSRAISGIPISLRVLR